MTTTHHIVGLKNSLPTDFALLSIFAVIFINIVSNSFALFYDFATPLFLLLNGLLSIGGSYLLVNIFYKKHIYIRKFNEKIYVAVLFCFSAISILVTIGIIFTLLGEAIRFFQSVSIFEFIFGLHWNPQVAFHNDQAQNDGSFGSVALFLGTLLISLISISIALPIGLMTAIYLSEYASPKVKSVMKPFLEVLAGIPTVVYGFFAALAVAPLLRNIGHHIHLDIASESALAAGLVMGIMIIPFISSLSEDVLNAIPNAQREGSYALGATQSETILKVLLPTAMPGLFAAVLLALSRAIGETMIVVMAAGLVAKLTLNPLDAVTTVTVQIVTLLIGDSAFDNPRTLAAFALGLALFTVTLSLNVLSLYILNKKKKNFGTL